MTKVRRANSRPNANAGRPTKKRTCLMCTDAFASQWAGERICPRCKGTSAWREGATADFASTGTHR